MSTARDTLNTYRAGPDERGHFGIYGGRFVAETLMPLILDLERAYERSTADAQAVRDRIDAVESVAEALFKEWQAELDEYTSDSLRRASQKQLSDTRERYEDLMAAMRRAESKIQPVLDAFHDQVLFLKHNLNAKAIASLQDELVSVETDITALVREMQASIDEANAFIESMSATQ